LLIFQQGLATCTTSLFFWQLLKQLIVSCKDSDLVSEVAACPLMPRLRNLFAGGNAFDSFDMEHGKIVEDRQLVKMGGHFIFLLSLHPV
jgi:hypothetical protein